MSGKTSGNMSMSGYFGQFSFFFQKDSANRYPKENPLNLEEDLEEDLLNYKQI